MTRWVSDEGKRDPVGHTYDQGDISKEAIWVGEQKACDSDPGLILEAKMGENSPDGVNILKA